MDNLFLKKIPVYFETEKVQLIPGDAMKILAKMKPESVDLIFADPPYFLSNGGVTCQGGRMVSVNKGEWDKLSEEATNIDAKHKFNRKWIRLCKKVLKPSGTIWISGTLHNIYSIGMALEQEGFKIINNITWKKILRIIWDADVLLILRKRYYGLKKMTRRQSIFSIIER